MYVTLARHGARAAAKTPPWPALAAFAALLAVGCAKTDELVPVAGKVLIDGEPLSQGTIQFVPELGRPAVAKIQPDGAYRLSTATTSNPAGKQGVKRGKYRIAVSAFEVLDEQTESVRWFAPSQYAQHLTSGLEADISGPVEDLVLKLSWEGAEHEDQQPDDEGETTEVEEAPEDSPPPQDSAAAVPPAEDTPPANDDASPPTTADKEQ